MGHAANASRTAALDAARNAVEAADAVRQIINQVARDLEVHESTLKVLRNDIAAVSSHGAGLESRLTALARDFGTTLEALADIRKFHVQRLEVLERTVPARLFSCGLLGRLRWLLTGVLP
ncbi:MAG: hypothetical protein IT181_13140 [Acidobacteria bacterium]|nr:hypothetical protein [Acidobacteriota bacterium]